MAPGLSLQEISEKVKSEKEFGAEWTRAKKALQEELDLSKDSALPTFLPSGSCARTVRYGHVVYDKAALLSSDQLVALVGKTARQLNLTPWTGDSSKPGSSTDSQHGPIFLSYCFVCFVLFCLNLGELSKSEVR
jgi:hypothetical protein